MDEENSCLKGLDFDFSIFTCGEASRSMDHNWPFVCPFESSQGSLYRPEKHGNIGN